MKKSILAALLCAIAVFAVACGGGNNAAKGNGTTGGGNEAGKCGGGETAADAWATYRKDGRSCTHKMAGDMKMTTTIKNVTDKGCDQVTQMYGADGKEMGPANTTPIEFKTAAAAADGKAVEAPKSKEEKVKSAAGEFDCISYDDGKTWMMKKYPQIIVKSEAMELVEFKE